MSNTCSSDWANPGLPAWGTAARARFWVGLEQPGPWGSKAPTQSRLDPDIGAALNQWCLSNRGRFLLLRAPGGAEDRNPAQRRVFVAGNLAGLPWLGTTNITSAASLLGLLQEAPVATAAERPEQFAHHVPIMTICTNARRDQCCALGGLSLARELFDEHPGQIWECSHLGGHRFAPTALLWPTGQTLGRLDPAAAATGLRMVERELIWGAGPWHDRGRSHLEPPLQAAEAYVRATLAPMSPGALTAVMHGEDLARVTHTDGRTWILSVVKIDVDDHKQVSCGKPAIPTMIWQVEPT